MEMTVTSMRAGPAHPLPPPSQVLGVNFEITVTFKKLFFYLFLFLHLVIVKILDLNLHLK